MVRKGGLEPPCPCGRSHLKAVRLPISPLPLVVNYGLEPTSSNSYLNLALARSPEFQLLRRSFPCQSASAYADIHIGASPDNTISSKRPRKLVTPFSLRLQSVIRL